MTSNPARRLAIALAVSCAAALSACGYEPIRTSQQTFCAHHDLGPNCEGLVARSLWWPDIVIENDASGAAMISCHSGSSGKLQVNAHVKNFGWSSGGPFWTRFDTSYSGTASPETYYVFSGWELAGLSTSGISPFVTGGIVPATPSPFSLAGTPTAPNELDVVVTYESRRTNPAAAIQPGMTYNIAATDGPFTIRVRTNVQDPTDPSKPIANVGTSDRTVTCTAG
jgi:hypothetical protein